MAAVAGCRAGLRATDGMDGLRRGVVLPNWQAQSHGRRRRITASLGNGARYYNTLSLRRIGVQMHMLAELD